MKSPYGEELESYRTALRTFYRKEVEPRVKEFEVNGVSRDIWRKAGDAGLLGVCVPEEYGGAGDKGLAIVLGSEELGYSSAGATVGAFFGTDICTLFLVGHGTDEQKQFWFPKILSGEAIQCMGMTEPQTGSDAFQAHTTARRDGDHYVINGQKCFISNGSKANLLYIIARTDPAIRGPRGLSMIIVPSETPGVTQRRMKTMGYPGGDTGEIFLDNVRVPVSNLVGNEGNAPGMFHNIMALDRLQVCARSVGAVQHAFEITLEYIRSRKIFNQRVVDFQNSQFVLAEAEVDVDVARAYLEKLIERYRDGEFTDRDGSRCKIWFSDMENRVVDKCLQLWGGNGWMDDMPIARMYTAARLQKIHVGPNELHKSLMGRRYVKDA
ncbi:MAG: acyl-CoA dehydrogenase family protein [Steroidobacteraceae bacterium]